MDQHQKTSSYRRLIGWQKAMRVCLSVYRATDGFPPDERFGLISEARKTSRSVLYNIAEGQQRATPAEFIRFLQIARGSQSELESQIILAKNLGYLTDDKETVLLEETGELGKILFGLVRYLRSKTHNSHPDPRRE